MKKFIFGLVIGLVIATIVGVVAYSLASKDIEYDNTNTGMSATNVQDAIDELRNVVINGSAKVYYLGSGTSFDLKTLLPDVDYTTLTAANFIVEAGNKALTTVSSYSTGGSGDYIQGRGTLTKSYAPSTGILTAYYNMYSIVHIHCDNGAQYFTKPINWNLSVKAYLVIGEIETP